MWRATLLVLALASIPTPLAVAGIDWSGPTTGMVSVLRGRASYYANTLIGRETASGERYDANALTAAHPALPLGTVVRVVQDSTQRAVVVRINDRGPYARGRAIDLSRRAAQLLGMTRSGVCDVTIEVVSLPDSRSASRLVSTDRPA